MKATTLFLLGAVALASTHAAQQVVPDPYPESRYDKLKAEWPFTLAKVEEKKEEEKASWATNLYLSSVVMQQTAEGGEQPWVTIKDKQEPSSFIQLTLNEEKNGMQLVKVENLDDPKKTIATVKKNNEFAPLKRDESSFAQTAAPPPGGLRPGVRVPGQPAVLPVGNPQNSIRMPGAQPAAPNAAPKLPAIPRPSNAVPQPSAIPAPVLPNAAPAGQQPTDARKRIRVINNAR